MIVVVWVVDEDGYVFNMVMLVIKVEGVWLIYMKYGDDLKVWCWFYLYFVDDNLLGINFGSYVMWMSVEYVGL